MDIHPLLGKEFDCPRCGRRHRVDVRELLTSSGASRALPELLRRLLPGTTPRVMILADPTTWDVAGEAVFRLVRGETAAIPLVLSPRDEPELSVRDAYLPSILEAAREADGILSVGSGTVTDLGKYAADRLGVPVISFPTAPSMNAYTSGVASLIVRGLKGVFPVRPAAAVVTDIDVVSRAPADMVRAGFADSLAKAYANADWRLASFFTGETVCPLPLEIVTEAESGYIRRGRDLAAGNPVAIRALMEGLHLGGISMLIAGKSSPASGAEHLVSHFLDMFAHHRDRPVHALHGIQVGLGILLSARVYRRLAEMTEEQVRASLASRAIDYDTAVRETETVFSGQIPLQAEFEAKQEALRRMRERLPSLWERFRTDILPLLPDWRTTEDRLRNAGCPTSFREIGVPADILRVAVLHARYIRGRITVLDAADEMNMLEDIASDSD